MTTKELLDLYPMPDHYDAQGDELGHVPYTPAFFAALATMIARRFHALKRPPCKVIALDCDHTLWAGICGEDGPGGVELDPPRRALQEFMRGQLDAGRLLCLCSKNNEDDVTAVFNRIKEMPLQPEHFVTRKINWNPKSANLRELADELNLGLDSFALVDDSPMECAEVAANCPEVTALQLPEQPELIPQFLKHCWVFDTTQATAEDARRTVLYQQNLDREALRKESLSFAEFITRLELNVAIKTLSLDELPRVSQLTQRTNQFNTTTHRRTETDLQRWLGQNGGTILTVRVADRFGDYGLVGAVVCREQKESLDVDSLLLSCRVLGKGVEYKMLARLGQLARERGLSTVAIHFTLSAKNQPAQAFLDTVAAQFRQAQNGGFVYAIPTEMARSVAFKPEEASDIRGRLAGAKENSPSPLLQRNRFNRWQWLALEASDPQKLLEQIKRAKPTRRGKRTSELPTTALEKQLCELWQELLRIDRVGIHDDFFELGGHSFLAVRLFARIEKLTGKRLPVVTIFQSPTIAQLVERIAATSTENGSLLIVPLQPKGTRPPLFLVHGAGGDAIWGYANLAQHLSADQPVYGIQPRVTDAPDRFDTLEAMAADYVAELCKFQPRGPYCLGGYCFGGSLAYEMARQLTQQGHQVPFVALLESSPEGGSYERAQWWRPAFPFQFTRNACFWLKDFFSYTSEERRDLIRRKVAVRLRKVRKRFSGERSEAPVDLDDIIDLRKFQPHEIKLWDAHLALLVRHKTQPYSGRVTVFRTTAHPLFSSYEHDLGWGTLVRGGVTVKIVAGSHGKILLEPNVRDLARNVSAALDEITPTTEMSSRKLQPV